MSSHGSSNVFFRASRVSKYMHLVRNCFVSVTIFNFKSVIKMQDTAILQMKVKVTGQDRKRSVHFGIKNASVLILA